MNGKQEMPGLIRDAPMVGRRFRRYAGSDVAGWAFRLYQQGFFRAPPIPPHYVTVTSVSHQRLREHWRSAYSTAGAAGALCHIRKDTRMI